MDILLNEVSFNKSFVQSKATEKEFIEHPSSQSVFPKLSQEEREKHLKEVYAIAHDLNKEEQLHIEKTYSNYDMPSVEVDAAYEPISPKKTKGKSAQKDSL